VVRAALDEEHGIAEPDAAGLQDFTAMAGHAMQMAVTVDEVAAAIALKDANGRRLIDNQSVKYRLGRCIARTEAALSTPEMFGRVAVAQTMREISVDLTDILGTAGSLPVDTDGSLDGGAAEYLFRWSLPTGIYGGTLEVFRNMIAQHALGLGRPNYVTTK
jgi:alkylation response protein AidB-like acyl-CoA dehydrogenase